MLTAAASDTVADDGCHRDPSVLTRISFWFTARGARGACFAGSGEDRLQLEAWSFEGPSPRWWPLPLAQPVTGHDQPLPLDDGRILLCRNGVEVHELTLVEQDDGATRERTLAVVDTPGLRLLPRVGKDDLAVAISFDGVCSTIWRMSAHAPHLVRLAELEGLLEGGVWLDETATLLGVNRAQDGGPAKAGAVDLEDGSWAPLLDVSTSSNDRLLCYSPRSKLLLVSTDAPGQARLGWARLGSAEPVCFPETLHRPDQAVQPLTLDSDGERVLVQLEDGVRSRLAVYTPEQDRLTPVGIPPGRVGGTACWTDNVLRFPFTSPSRPPCIATVDLDGTGRCSLAGHGPDGTRWADAHIERLEGAAGFVEAIVYGGEGWRASRHLLLALHGGPVEAWRFEFDRFFQRLAAAGIAVVALNQRGGSGYGVQHRLAIRGAWGGPDLDDVRCVARALAAERCALGAGELMLCGSSYGAFLALLAASCEPDLWSHCVALAPFLSGPRLYHDGSPEVRALLEQLGGVGELHDDLGPRDVLRLCHAIRAKLLVVHGECDEMIPADHSRALRQRLLASGKREGMDFVYVEVPAGRHGLVTDSSSQALHERLVRFLLTRTSPKCSPVLRQREEVKS
ncbi:MAG: alpha/beta hydrolase family protein [Egibacteraceae bacterium]